MKKVSAYFTLGNTGGKHGVKEIKQGLDTLPGVVSVSVSSSSNQVAVDFDATGVQKERIEKQLQKMGYEVLDAQIDDCSAE